MPRPPSPGPVTSPYGMRRHPVTGDFRMHWGQDHGWREGREVVAPEGGTVNGFAFTPVAGWMLTFGGLSGAQHRLAHLTPRLADGVKIGSRVSEGDRLATMGDTGAAVGVHLHWEVIRAGRFINPQDWLSSFATTNTGTPIPMPSRKEHDMYVINVAGGGGIRLVTNQGSCRLGNPYHVELFTRMLSAEPGREEFNAAEADIITAYIHAAATADDDSRARILKRIEAIEERLSH